MLKLAGELNNWLENFRENKLSLENTILCLGDLNQKVHLVFKHSTPDDSCPGAGVPHLCPVQARSLVSSLTWALYHMKAATWPSDLSKPSQTSVAQPSAPNLGTLPSHQAASPSVGSASRKQMSLHCWAFQRILSSPWIIDSKTHLIGALLEYFLKEESYCASVLLQFINVDFFKLVSTVFISWLFQYLHRM